MSTQNTPGDIEIATEFETTETSDLYMTVELLAAAVASHQYIEGPLPHGGAPVMVARGNLFEAGQKPSTGEQRDICLFVASPEAALNHTINMMALYLTDEQIEAVTPVLLGMVDANGESEVPSSITTAYLKSLDDEDTDVPNTSHLFQD